MNGFYTIHFICFQKRRKLIDVIFRFQEDIFGSIFPILQKIGRIILVLVLLNQNGNHFLVDFRNVPSKGMSITPTALDLSFDHK